MTDLKKGQTPRGLLVGDDLKAWREEMDLTQPQLGALLPAKYQTIHNWEDGLNIGAKNLRKLKRIVEASDVIPGQSLSALFESIHDSRKKNDGIKEHLVNGENASDIPDTDAVSRDFQEQDTALPPHLSYNPVKFMKAIPVTTAEGANVFEIKERIVGRFASRIRQTIMISIEGNYLEPYFHDRAWVEVEIYSPHVKWNEINPGFYLMNMGEILRPFLIEPREGHLVLKSKVFDDRIISDNLDQIVIIGRLVLQPGQ